MTAAMFHVKQYWRANAATTTLHRWCNAALIGLLLAATAPAAAQDAEPAPETLPPGTVLFTDSETRTASGSEVARQFRYTWPAEVAAVPALVRRFTAERAEMLADQKSDFVEGLSFADAEGCFGCNRDLAREWAVTADTPRFLVLSGSLYIYSGGAHGNTGFEALVWDRKAKKAFDSRRLFRSKPALQAALGEGWCAGLKAERRAKMGEETSATIEEDGIFPCPPIAELQIYPASSDGQRFDRIDLLAAPYVAGSYAEGVYEVTLPVTPEVLAAVRPQYKAAFTLAK
jgi:hypothetical protein